MIQIIAPDVAENGASVPVEIRLQLPQVERVLLIGERNLFPLLADASFAPGLEPWFEARVKLAQGDLDGAQEGIEKAKKWSDPADRDRWDSKLAYIQGMKSGTVQP